MFALTELYHTLADAWRAADLSKRLREWRWVVTHQCLLNSPVSEAPPAPCGREAR